MIQDDHYSLLPIAFIAAKHNYSIELLLTSITSSPVYILTLSSKETSKEIIDFYVKCSYSCSGPLFQTINYISNVLNTNFTIKKKMLIESITSCMEVCENLDPKVISTYLMLTRFYLLIRDNRKGNEYINILCKNNSFTISFSYFQTTSGTSCFIREEDGENNLRNALFNFFFHSQATNAIQ